ncbi:hypothetical protein GR11A_00245 [Vibrio phage vB_VcorM_GR11A]|nr:hypothetical protein GR11A_00245 [Vibrio phage vB_VcorM_GR11A]
MATTQHMLNCIDDLNRKFTYVADKFQYGVRDYWTFMGQTAHGDCEDYSLTLLRNLEGSRWGFWKALMRKKASLYYCTSKTTGSGHCILKYGDRWTDNIQRRWVTKGDMEVFSDIQYRYPLPLIVLKFMGATILKVFR